mmetsp:Transcript_7754/g.16830  ORF Transcript_7754/g.16830 Transcript_7754/m.16830 type:complete len:249 (-) Transcript_7754:198-944(-)|eukprot:CAMPEP_0113321538 /NCGR_PEP_ID=MMETSP0010_2-20120614/14989_1 /TAXON_ID=216773 ORGANISM="Corethron hystrix, Strain 308" /NCGR_SAMPLE_ID=MMETSP0010_2 /ASSEMBLY_ACC=CAM_ASM_000155 /LENGTH=248 /DNA_ID=CAMNT_0000179705 /DNA_START=76 /DNA_END=822 /DNA_ORIENTATION=- /assembly_acc=CAM_ASM_000155
MSSTEYVAAEEGGGEDSCSINRCNPGWWSHPSPENAKILSVISCVATAVAAILGISMWTKTASISILSFGLENFIDLFSSAVIVWRFFPANNNLDNQEKIDALLAREKRASVAIAAVILMLGIQIIGLSIVRFRRGSYFDGDDFDQLTLAIALASSLIFGTLTMVKLHYADKLDSHALKKDGFCSAAGTILSFVVILETVVSDMDQNIWFFDPLIALIVGLSCIVVGARTLKNQEWSFLTKSFWMNDS